MDERREFMDERREFMDERRDFVDEDENSWTTKDESSWTKDESSWTKDESSWMKTRDHRTDLKNETRKLQTTRKTTAKMGELSDQRPRLRWENYLTRDLG